jgi:hypothetical protein
MVRVANPLRIRGALVDEVREQTGKYRETNADRPGLKRLSLHRALPKEFEMVGGREGAPGPGDKTPFCSGGFVVHELSSQGARKPLLCTC